MNGKVSIPITIDASRVARHQLGQAVLLAAVVEISRSEKAGLSARAIADRALAEYDAMLRVSEGEILEVSPEATASS